MKLNYLYKGLMVAAFVASSICMKAQDDFSFEETIVQDTELGLPMNVVCTKASLVRNIDEITAKMVMNLSNVSVKSKETVIFTPMIVNGEDTLKLASVGVYGRSNWYYAQRNNRFPMSGKGEIAMRADQKENKINYSETVEYDSWMNGATLLLQQTNYGCAGCKEKTIYAPEELASYAVVIYEPTFTYQAAVAEEVKTRELSGRAYVDFPVNLTTIFPDYRRNSIELAKIIGTIDSVKNDKDITVKSLTIKGFASPEGPYDNNVRLAKGRTEALKNYVQALYNFPYGFIQTSYEPEDWEGLREYVVSSTLPNKYDIIAIIDSNLAPDPKNSKIEKDYPDQYRFLLETVYPGLRHSDYTIEYVIRGFSDIYEIAEIMRTQPSKLSLDEMYLLASTMMPGSPEYNEVMETAVKMYPTDETAILNAASAAMQRGDLNQAERYLAKAGNSPDALYVRGILAGLQEDYPKAIWFMEQAQARGNQQAAAELEKLQNVKKYSK